MASTPRGPINQHQRHVDFADEQPRRCQFLPSSGYGAMTATPMSQPAICPESDGYERFMGRWSSRLAPQLVSFASVNEADAVLDVGCGTGALSRAAAAIPFTHVAGVDPSSSYISHAKKELADARIRFEVGDALALRFRGATFDRTLSLLMLNHLPDPAARLREMIRVTRPNGIVAAAVWDYGHGMEMLRIFWDEANALDPTIGARDQRQMPPSRPGELTALWQARGLHNVEERPLTIDLRFSSFDDFWQPFLSDSDPLVSMPPRCQDPPAGRYGPGFATAC
jgi:SAM-dependent methyltransferase